MSLEHQAANPPSVAEQSKLQVGRCIFRDSDTQGKECKRYESESADDNVLDL